MAIGDTNGWLTVPSSQYGQPQQFRLSRDNVDIRPGQATENLLFAWMRVRIKGSLKLGQVKSRVWCHVSGAQRIYDTTAFTNQRGRVCMQFIFL